MELQELLVYALVVAAFVAVGWAFMPRGGASAADLAGREPGWDRLPSVFRSTWGFMALFGDSLGAMLAGWMPDRAKRLSELAVTAALPLTAGRVLAACLAMGIMGLLLGVATTAVLYVVMPDAWIPVGLGACILFFVVGWFWPSQNLASYAEERQDRITKALPFAIDLIGSAMRSGLEFGAAMRYYVSLGSGGPLEEEFGKVLSDTTLGRPFAESMADMARRVRIEAFTAFMGVVSYGMEIGAPIADTLKMHGDELRRARFAIAERKAMRAPSIMIIPLVLCIMPAVFIIVLTPMIMKLKGMN